MNYRWHAEVQEKKASTCFLCHTAPMPFNVATYNPRPSFVHGIDARVKIILVFAYSITLFLVSSWFGMFLCLLVFVLGSSASHLPFRRAVRQLLPLGIVLLVALVSNSFSFDAARAAGNAIDAGSGGLPPWFSSPVIIAGSFGFVPTGCIRGCFYVVRIVLLVFASLILTSTTTSTDMTRALESFLSPLGKLGVPTRDAATIVSIALRFIPVTVDEFHMVKAAQTARGASFDTGALRCRLHAWETVLIPLFVGLYRRADDLSCAMEARCYGVGAATRLDQKKMPTASSLVLIFGLLVCVLIVRGY